MTSTIKNLLENILIPLNSSNKSPDLNEIIAILLDISGSTGEEFNNITVLQKEINIAKSIALNNKNGKTHLFTFHTVAKYVAEIKFTTNGSVLFPPNITPLECTNTNLGFKEIIDKYPSIKITKVILITDGQLSEYRIPYGETIGPNGVELKNYSKQLQDKGIEINVIAVSSKNINFSDLQVQEQKKVPGLDVVNILNVNSKIYTPEFNEIPYELSKSVNISNKEWLFLGISISRNSVPLPILITTIINALLDSEINFASSSIQEELQLLFIDIGMYIGLMSIKYPDFFNENLIELQIKTGSDLCEFVQYGFNLKRNNQPLINANLKQNLIDFKKQKECFENAHNSLELDGTALKNSAISIFNGVVCLMDDSSTLIRNGIYSMDTKGNIYFSFNIEYEQAIRQALRQYCGEFLGFKDSRNSPSVIFALANQILLYLLACPDINLEHSHIEILRKIARIQIGQKMQNRDRSYGNSFLEEWKSGNLPPTHCMQKKTHSDYYSDIQINKLSLSQTLWWAVMMMIFGDGLFQSQMHYYQETLLDLNIELTENSLLTYLRANFSSKVSGTVNFCEQNMKTSAISLDYFEPGTIIYEDLPHPSLRNSQICKTKTHYSEEERMNNGFKCFWCNRVLKQEDFKRVEPLNQSDLVNSNFARFIASNTSAWSNVKASANTQPSNANTSAWSNVKAPVSEALDTWRNSKPIAHASIDTRNSNTWVSNTPNNRQHLGKASVSNGSASDTWRSNTSTQIANNKKHELKRILLLMQGTVGSGKTTIAGLIEQKINEINGVCINEGTDKYCVRGISTREARKIVNSVLRGISRIRNDLIVVIIDTCGEQHHGNIIFDYSFEGWEIHTIRPNFDDSRLKQYLSWSLYNVLNRPLHSHDSKFWLNPESASHETCKKVHTDKAKALFGHRFVEVSTKTDLQGILADITSDALEYQEFLNSYIPLEETVNQLIQTICR